MFPVGGSWLDVTVFNVKMGDLGSEASCRWAKQVKVSVMFGTGAYCIGAYVWFAEMILHIFPLGVEP